MALKDNKLGFFFFKKKKKNQPTKHPPPGPLEFLMLTGRFPQRAMTGYALTVPAEERCVLSAYNMNAKGAPFSGIDDY